MNDSEKHHKKNATEARPAKINPSIEPPANRVIDAAAQRVPSSILLPWGKMLISFLVVLGIIGIKQFIEYSGHHNVGTSFADFLTVVDQYGHNLLQRPLTERNQSQAEQISIVDISGLIAIHGDDEQTTNNADTAILAKKDVYTPRQQLKNVVQAIADYHPYAIGIDIDFSNNPSYVEGAETFLQEMGAGVVPSDQPGGPPIPVVLGVYRNRYNDPSEWLGKNLQNLAACIDLGRSEESRFADPTQVQLWVQGKVDGKRLKGFGPKLAEYLPGADLLEETSNTWWRESTHETFDLNSVDAHTGTVALYATYTLKTGYLPQIFDARRIDGYSREILKIRSRDLTHKVVLLGDVSDAEDYFSIWGVSNTPYPGVVMHACAALTCNDGLLYRLTRGGDIVADALVSAILILISGFVCTFLFKTDFHSMQLYLSVLGIFAVYGIATYAASFSILWTDYWIVALALLIHYPVEHIIVSSFKFIKSRLRAQSDARLTSTP